MSLTTQASGMPQPIFAWQFEGTTTDYISGLTPFASVLTAISYNSIGKYGSSLVNTNTAGAAPASYLRYNIGTLNDITITSWVKPYNVSTATNQVILGVSDSTGTVNNLLQFIVASSQITIYGQNPTGGTPLLTVSSANTPVVSGVWIHLGISMSATGAVSIYINGAVAPQIRQYSAGTPNGIFGQLWNTWTAKSLIVTSNTRFPGTNSGANCEIDDIRVYNTVLNTTQFQSIYAAGGMPNTGSGTITNGTSVIANFTSSV